MIYNKIARNKRGHENGIGSKSFEENSKKPHADIKKDPRFNVSP